MSPGKKSGTRYRGQEDAIPLIRLATSLLLAAFFLGCSPREVPPFSGQVLAGLGRIELMAASRPPGIHITVIPSGVIKGAAQGAGSAVVSTMQGCVDFDPTGICLIGTVILSPYIAAGGAIYGLFAVRSEKDVRASRNSIAAAMAGQDYNRSLLEGVFRTGENMAGGRGMFVIPQPVPKSFGAAGSRLDGKFPAPDSLLELRVMEVTLGKRPAVDPRVRLHIKIQVRLIRPRESIELFSKVISYKSVDRHGFIQWGERNAILLRNGLKLGLRHLAEKIVKIFFASAASLESLPGIEPPQRRFPRPFTESGEAGVISAYQ